MADFFNIIAGSVIGLVLFYALLYLVGYDIELVERPTIRKPPDSHWFL